MIELLHVPHEEFLRVRGLPIEATERTEILATLCRINTLYMIKKAGSGHIGSSFSSLDIVCWLHCNVLRTPNADTGDVYFSSKGHDVPGLYAVLLGLGWLEFDLIHRLRRLNGLPGHPDVGTPHFTTNTGSLGMGISKAKGMVLADRLRGRTRNIFVLTGDGELQEGQIWESLQQAANLRLGEITVIVDHNKMQSDTRVSKVSDLGDLPAKFASFGWHVGRCDGHDYVALQERFENFRHVSNVPKVLVADTIKGRGVSFMEHTAMGPEQEFYRFHSGAPSDSLYQEAVTELIARGNEQLAMAGAGPVELAGVLHQSPTPNPKAENLVTAYSKALVRVAEQDDRVVVLDADLVCDCGLVPFRDRFPDRFYECGIAEQDMVSQAGGLALFGMRPIVHSFACFLSARPNEQIYNNATEHTKIVYTASLAGLLPAGPGHSHQCVRDLSTLRGVPGLVLLEPSNEREVGLALEWCMNGTEQSCYLRLISIPCELPYELPESYRLEEGRGVALTQGRDAVLFAYGPILLSEAYKAATRLAEHGIGLKVVNLPWLNRLDLDWLARTVAGVSTIFTLDNHYLEGGQGQFIASQLAQANLAGSKRIRCLGIDRVPDCGSNAEVLKSHGLDADALFREVRANLRKAA